MSRRLVSLIVLWGASAFSACATTIVLSGPQLRLTFDVTGDRFSLTQISKLDQKPLLYSDREASVVGHGPIGNPFAVVIRQGAHKGVWMPSAFKVISLQHDDRSLLVYLQHDALPLQMVVQVDVEGSVATWKGQVLWNGEDGVDLDVYLPLLSRVKFESLSKDRLLAAEVSGMVENGLGSVSFSDAYAGSMSGPFIQVEGGNRGLAIVDDNRAEYAADPGACAMRGMVVANTFPVSEMVNNDSPRAKGGTDGPYVGVRYTKRLRAISAIGGRQDWDTAEKIPDSPPVQKLGDSVEIGPVRMYTYSGDWRQGALWLRKVRSGIVFRKSPAQWYRDAKFIADDMGDQMLRRGETFWDYPKLLANKQRMGADLFTIPGFSEAEILGSKANFLNRGDYVMAAENLGGGRAAREGIAALHRANGHILYYLEGLIIWKRSEVGRNEAKQWAIMNEDGSYSVSYNGFYDMCPAVKEWQDWLARTSAELVKSIGVDGFFIDSLTATNNHRCFNPTHHHPHPDVWTWGVRQLVSRVREEVDKVNPGTVIITEGEADIVREFTDGFIAHSGFWNQGKFTEPLLRFIYKEMNAFESWGYGQEPQEYQIFNAVHGHLIYAHDSNTQLMAPIALNARKYDDSYPEITEAPLSSNPPTCSGCLVDLFEGSSNVVTVGNPTSVRVKATLQVPGPGSLLFDRVAGQRLPMNNGIAEVDLGPWEFRAFEIRP